MKILFIHQNFPGQFKFLAPALAERGHEVLATTSGEIEKITVETTIKIISLYSHLAASEDLDEQVFTRNQINKFKFLSEEIIKGFEKKPLLHICLSLIHISEPTRPY